MLTYTLVVFGFGKISVSTKSLAQELSRIALSPLADPVVDDLTFQAEAVKHGMSELGFSLEAAALQVFTLAACVRRRLLDGAITDGQANEVLGEYMVECERLFLYGLPVTVQIDLAFCLGLNTQTAFERLLGRLDRYASPEHVSAPNKSIPYLFAEFCGVPDPNETLMRIGWGIFIGRGVRYVDQLKTIKLARTR